jgi:hypothetical protein
LLKKKAALISWRHKYCSCIIPSYMSGWNDHMNQKMYVLLGSLEGGWGGLPWPKDLRAYDKKMQLDIASNYSSSREVTTLQTFHSRHSPSVLPLNLRDRTGRVAGAGPRPSAAQIHYCTGWPVPDAPNIFLSFFLLLYCLSRRHLWENLKNWLEKCFPARATP